MMHEISYAENLRKTMQELPIKKKCCAHAFQDATILYEQDTPAAVRADAILHYGEHAKCASCLSHFVRALFCRRGSVTAPDKRYHLELAFDSEEECAALCALLTEQGIAGRITQRKKQHIFYLKDGEAIADFLAYLGANTAAFDFMNSRIAREFRNNVNRQVNCDTANIEKTLLASERQIHVIRRMKETGALGTLPDSLRETAELRLTHEQLSLKELGEAHNPPITKSGVNHRLSKIMEAARAMHIE